MKVTTTINGTEIMIENDDYNEIIGFVNKISQKEKENGSVKAIEHEERVAKTAELNTWQSELWNWLADNDCETGLPIAGAARAFGVNQDAMGQRLARLVKMGYATRPIQGRYRAKTP